MIKIRARQGYLLANFVLEMFWENFLDPRDQRKRLTSIDYTKSLLRELNIREVWQALRKYIETRQDGWGYWGVTHPRYGENALHAWPEQSKGLF